MRYIVFVILLSLPSWATIAWVNEGDSSTIQSNVSSVQTGAQNLTAGNALFCAVRWVTSSATTISTVTDTAGNTFSSVSAFSSGTVRLQTWYVVNALGNAADHVTITFSNSTGTFIIAVCDQFSGVGTSVTADTTASGTCTTCTTVTSGTFTTAQASEFVYCNVVVGDSGAFQVTAGTIAGQSATIGTGATDSNGPQIGTEWIQLSSVATNQTASAGYSGAGASMWIQADTFKLTGVATPIRHDSQIY